LSKILSLAVDAGLIETNPSHRVKKFRLNNQRMRVLSTEEEERLLDALKAMNWCVELSLLLFIQGSDAERYSPGMEGFRYFDRETIEVRESKSGKKRLVPMNRSRCVYFEKNSWAFGHQDDGAVHACY